MAIEIRIVKHNWGYDMTSTDENCLILRKSLNVNQLVVFGGHASREILNFRSSEIVENLCFSIYFQESLTKN